MIISTVTAVALIAFCPYCLIGGLSAPDSHVALEIVTSTNNLFLEASSPVVVIVFLGFLATFLAFTFTRELYLTIALFLNFIFKVYSYPHKLTK